MKIHMAIILAASWLVPRATRREWLAEWKAELWYVQRAGGGNPTSFCLGAILDAGWMRRDRSARLVRSGSPARCMIFLAALAAVSLPWALRTAHLEHAVLRHLLIILLALIILPSTVSLETGEYFGANTLGRWMFFVVKVAMLTVIAICVFTILAATGLAPIAANVLLTGYVLAFRWALIDQRARCPVCLHLVRHPIRIGLASQTFLGWYGIESICTDGHGLLHVTETRSSCYGAQTWHPLDSSWRELFP